MPTPSSDLDTALDYRRAEFATLETERRFRQWFHRGAVSQTRLTLLITLMVLVVYILSDYLMLHASGEFFYSLQIRSLIFAAGLLTIGFITINQNPALFDRAIFLFQALAIGLLLHMLGRFLPDVVATSLSVVLLVIAMYLFIPNRLISASLLSLSLSIGFLGITMTAYDIDRLLLLQMCMILLGANLMGATFCGRFHLVKRKEFLELMRERSAREALQEEIAKRLQLEKQLLHQTRTDELTGATNRRYFMELGGEEINRCRRYGRNMSLLMIDLDHFKQINDRFGHGVGDEALLRFSELCGSTLRKSDIFGRLGGEEFAIIIPEESLHEAEQTAERLRKRVELAFASTPYRLTISVGVCELGPDDKSIGELLSRADAMMYKAKDLGRNRVISLMQTEIRQ
jgi:diguanylate cyclase (GGDEF)-like protein